MLKKKKILRSINNRRLGPINSYCCTFTWHWPRKHSSVSTSSANSEEPEPRPPSCAPSTEAPSRASLLAASLCGMAPANASCRKSLQRIVRAAEKIVGVSLPSLQDIYSTRLTRKALCIAGDPTHPTDLT